MKKMSFDRALNTLEEIVEKLEMGQLSLEESLKIFEQGVELSLYCRKELEQSETKIARLIKRMNGELELEEVELQ